MCEDSFLPLRKVTYQRAEDALLWLCRKYKSGLNVASVSVTPNFRQCLGLLRNFETDGLIRFEIPPPALSLLKIPSYQTATSSQIIGFSCCSSAAFSSDRICSDHFLAIFLIVNRAHSATVYITTIQIIPS